MRTICVITGTRAEYGLLQPLMEHVRDADSCHLQVVVTNMHLLPEYGLTYRQIEEDGFHIDAAVPMPKQSDDAHGVVSSMATEMSGMNDALCRLHPDIAVILGDRYEMLVAATVCMMHRIPIAHIHGGEITEGAYDDSIRHCITKMSALHFTATEQYRRRVIQLGELPLRVFNVGALGVENIHRMTLLTRDELSQKLGLDLALPLIVVTYHPATLSSDTAAADIISLLHALQYIPDYQVIFTMPNSDEGSSLIATAIESYCGSRDNAHCYKSLGSVKYLSLLQYANAVVGNSSSGIIEAPSMHVPTLNIGDRQKGRIRGDSVIDCGTDADAIIRGLQTVLSTDFRTAVRSMDNPYDRPGTSDKIFEVLSSTPLNELQQKTFYDIAQ